MNQIDQLIESKMTMNREVGGKTDYSDPVMTLTLEKNSLIKVDIPLMLDFYSVQVGADLTTPGAAPNPNAWAFVKVNPVSDAKLDRETADRVTVIWKDYNNQVNSILTDAQKRIVAKVKECIKMLNK